MRIRLGLIAAGVAGLATFAPAHAANVATGRYTLTAQNSNRCVQAANGSTGVGVQLQQSTCNNGAAQQYDISPTDSGYYKIINASSGLSVDIRNYSLADGAVVQQASWNNSNAQHFLLEKNGKGYVIRNRNSFKCLDITGWNDADGGALQQSACTGGANQTFALTATGGSNQTVVDARYTVKVASTGKCLDVPNSSTADSVQLQQWSCNSTAAQQWDFTYVGNSLYEIKNANSGKCVDLKAGGTANGTVIQQYACNQGSNQRFKVTGLGNGQYQIVPSATTRAVEIAGASTADGAKTDIWDNTSANNQKWTLEQVSYAPNVVNGTYRFISVNSNKCIDLPNSSTSPGQALQQWTCNSTNAQNFTVTHVSDGYYKLVNVASGLPMSVRDFSSSGTAIEQNNAYDSDNQLFRFVAYGSGYLIRPKSNYLCFDINGASTADGAALKQYSCNYQNNQVFTLQKMAAAATLPAPGTAVNSDTIVLLHGFLGWDRGEMFGMKYWGGGWSGKYDLQEYLKSQGHPTVTLGVGPISSNWDRAVEAYYELKGGTVDYGAAHAAKHGHNRYGRTYTARVSAWDANNKIHIISHSQGGQTARVLIELLRNGSADERAASGTAVADLFKGGKNWVRSLTTVSTPHNGTTLTEGASMLGLTDALVKAAYVAAGLTTGENVVYDLKLDQWALTRNSGETWSSYFSRVKNNTIFNNSQDTSYYDLSADGAAALNQWVTNSPDVYYFSISNGSTFRGFWDGKQYPKLVNFLPLDPGSIFMGRYTRNQTGHVVIDSSWWENDTVVNTNSMAAPTGATSQTYNGTAVKGTWNKMPFMKDYGHLEIVGGFCFPLCKEINPTYLDLAKRLKALQ